MTGLEEPGGRRPSSETVSLDALLAAIGATLSSGAVLQDMLQACAEALVEHLDVALARIWIRDAATSELILRASAGSSVDLDGAHSRISLDDPGKVAGIARDREPLRTNELVDDPLFTDQAWLRRERIVGFAGHPLAVEDRAVGVLAVFARRALPESAATILTAVSHLIAVGVERKVAEEARAETELRYRHLFNNAPDYIMVVDPAADGGPVIVDVNEAACQVHGFSRQEMIGRKMAALDADDTAGLIPARARRLMTGERVVFESMHRHKDGRLFPVEVAAQLLDLGGRRYVFAIERDLTERKRMEADAMRAEKLESLGVMAAGIAHDFNNLLMAILGTVSAARAQLPGSDGPGALLDEAISACVRARELPKQLITYTRGGAPIIKPMYLDQVAREAFRFATTGTNVRARVITQGQPSPVLADASQVLQVFHNLAVNAVHAMSDGGEVVALIEDRAAESESEDEARWVHVAVRDEGPGIAPENLAKIFDPYFTTKDDGSGLGLTTVYSIVKRHGGHLTVDSVLGEGTTIHIDLPASAERPLEVQKVRGDVHSGQGRILVMDDDEAVREVVAAMLSVLGYEPTAVADGRLAVEAVRHVASTGESFDGIILDLTVRGGTGGMVAVREILAIDPKARVLVSSGYSDSPVMADCRAHGFCGAVAKPYAIEQLGRALRDALEPTAGGQTLRSEPRLGRPVADGPDRVRGRDEPRGVRLC